MWDVYIASSWKNRDRVRAVAEALRARGLRVYDFTDPACRQSPEIPPEKFPEQFDPAKHDYAEYLNSQPHWRGAVEGNRTALDESRSVLMLLPCGADSHADWAYAVGHGLPTCVVGHPPAGERTPSHLWADAMVMDDAAGVEWAVARLAQESVNKDTIAHLRADLAAVDSMLVGLTEDDAVQAYTLQRRRERIVEDLERSATSERIHDPDPWAFICADATGIAVFDQSPLVSVVLDGSVDGTHYFDDPPEPGLWFWEGQVVFTRARPFEDDGDVELITSSWRRAAVRDCLNGEEPAVPTVKDTAWPDEWLTAAKLLSWAGSVSRSDERDMLIALCRYVRKSIGLKFGLSQTEIDRANELILSANDPDASF